MSLKHVNAVIVGAGAGGGIAAKELSEAGLSTVLLERGENHRHDDRYNDELYAQRGLAIKLPYGPDDERYRRVIEAPDGKTIVSSPTGRGYGPISAGVGGGTLTYGAMGWRFMEQDFRMKSAYGEIEDSTLADWPLTYEDLEPYYEKAEWELGVSGDDSQNPFAPPRRKPQPMPPFPYNIEGKLLHKAASGLGWHPFPIPMLRNSAPYGGRPQCIHRRDCVGYACPIDAKAGSQNTVIPTALATGNCELRTNVQVFKVNLDGKGHAKGVTYYDRANRLRTQTADIVVMAANAVETARILLNSKSKKFPQGAGNNNGWVGHNLQSHSYCGAVGLFDHDVYEEAGPGACIAICDFNHDNPGVIGGGLMANEFIRLPVNFSQFRPPGAPRWGQAHKDFQRNFYKRHIVLFGPAQEIPTFESRIEIDPKITDAWGVPAVRFVGQGHEQTLLSTELLSDVAEKWLTAAGATEIWKMRNPNVKRAVAGHHAAGTCRMGNDPKTSVVNRHGQSHEIDNLFVVDGSLMVNNSGFNPALTIMALAYWVSDSIKAQCGIKGTTNE